MKKTLAILLVLTLVIGSFAACGGGEPAESEGPVNLVIAARGGSHVDVINAVKAQFEADNNCTIEVLGLEAADLKQKVSLDAKNEKGNLTKAERTWAIALSKQLLATYGAKT